MDWNNILITIKKWESVKPINDPWLMPMKSSRSFKFTNSFNKFKARFSSSSSTSLIDRKLNYRSSFSFHESTFRRFE